MSSPHVPYEFPAPLFIYHSPGAPGTDAPDVDTTCQWRAYDDIDNFGHGTYMSNPRFLVELVVPTGVDIRDATMSSVVLPDRISCTDDATHDYEVLWVEKIYRGFPKECYRVVARRLSVGLDMPLP